jgi:hypothetical protein
MDRAQVQVTSMRDDGDLRAWSNLIMDQADIADLDSDDPWDMVWAVTELMREHVMRHVERERRRG